MRASSFRLMLVLGFAAAASAAMAQGMPADAPGARDHAVLSRYAGSWLVAQDVKAFDRVSIPAGDTDAPLASNANETGRARNRRVEIVLQ